MSRIKSVTLPEFLWLIEYAQKHHADLDQPIPEVHESQYGKILSCLETPFQTFGGKYLYSGFYKKASILFYLINKNHSLINGNKRMACLTLGLFCFKNKYRLTIPWQYFYEIAKDVTNSEPEKMDVILGALEATFRKFIPKER